MSIKTILIGTLTSVLLATLSFSAAAGTDREEALNNGATQLTADEIAERFAGKTVTFVSASGEKRFSIYYSEGNEVAGKKIDGDWSDTGYYAIADNDTICLSWNNRDKPRLRCMYVLMVDGVVQKFKADGSLSGSIVKFEEGQVFFEKARFRS